jgi:Zn-dependent M16 (insulinase) family peptidase
LLASEPQLLLIGDANTLATSLQHNQNLWKTPPSEHTALSLDPIREQVKQAWLTNTQVNFCAKAFPTVPSDHPDAAALLVLGSFLRNGYLHRAIREQGGAYGGGASQDSNIAAFRFYSYRDPRCLETLQDFDRAIEWVQSHAHGEQQLEEAILSVIGSLDKPGSPAGEAKVAFQNRLFGRDDAFQQRFRSRILTTTITDLQRVAQTYLDPAKASTVILTSKSQWEPIKLSDFEVHQV